MKFLTKRGLFILLVIFIASSLFALDGKVVSVTGKVEMQVNGDNWVQLKEGDIVPQGAIISSGFKSQADIKLGGSLLTVYQLTRVSLRELSESTDKVTTDLYLDAGSVRADVKPLNNKANGFQVRTPVVTASVRGTDLGVSGDGGLNVYRGLVALIPMDTGTTRYINGGQSVKADGGNIPAPFANGSNSFTVGISGKSPNDKPTTDIQITGGELGDGSVIIPATGFEDSVEYAVVELQNGEETVITVDDNSSVVTVLN